MHIHRRIIERIVITGPQDESVAAFEYCINNGFRIIRSGPRQTSKNNYDPEQFEIIAEREMPSGLT